MDSNASSSIVRLNIGGYEFLTTVGTLTNREPQSMLAAMFSGRHAVYKDPEKGFVFIDRDGKHFGHVLNWLRDGVAPIPNLSDLERAELLREAEYYQLLGLVDRINEVLNKKKDEQLDTELTRADIIKSIQMTSSYVKLRGVNLSGLNLSGLDLSDAQLSYACLKSTSFSGADLHGARFMGANLQSANLQGLEVLNNAYLKNIFKNIFFSGANLQGARFFHADLHSANLQGANLSECKFNCVDLRSAHLETANLTNADLEGANLEGANFKVANLRNANLKNANLRHAHLEGANLDGAKLLGAIR